MSISNVKVAPGGYLELVEQTMAGAPFQGFKKVRDGGPGDKNRASGWIGLNSAVDYRQAVTYDRPAPGKAAGKPTSHYQFFGRIPLPAVRVVLDDRSGLLSAVVGEKHEASSVSVLVTQNGKEKLLSTVQDQALGDWDSRSGSMAVLLGKGTKGRIVVTTRDGIKLQHSYVVGADGRVAFIRKEVTASNPAVSPVKLDSQIPGAKVYVLDIRTKKFVPVDASTRLRNGVEYQFMVSKTHQNGTPEATLGNFRVVWSSAVTYLTSFGKKKDVFEWAMNGGRINILPYTNELADETWKRQPTW